MSESKEGRTPEEKKWEWEVISDPIERLKLIDASIEELIMQNVTTALGHAELAGSEGPRFEPHRITNARLATEAALLAGQRLRKMQTFLRQAPNLPLPIDRKTYPGRAIIALDQLPDPTTSLTPLPSK